MTLHIRLATTRCGTRHYLLPLLLHCCYFWHALLQRSVRYYRLNGGFSRFSGSVFSVACTFRTLLRVRILIHPALPLPSVRGSEFTVHFTTTRATSPAARVSCLANTCHCRYHLRCRTFEHVVTIRFAAACGGTICGALALPHKRWLRGERPPAARSLCRGCVRYCRSAWRFERRLSDAAVLLRGHTHTCCNTGDTRWTGTRRLHTCSHLLSAGYNVLLFVLLLPAVLPPPLPYRCTVAFVAWFIYLLTRCNRHATLPPFELPAVATSRATCNVTTGSYVAARR